VLALEDGRVMPFDVSASVVGVPDEGVSVEVQLGKSRLGGDKVTRLEVVTSWEPMTCPFLFLRKIDDETGDLILLRNDGLAREEMPLEMFEGAGELRFGATGYVIEEHKRGFDSATDTRIVRFWCEDIPASARAAILEAFRVFLEEEWEHWDHPDRSHTADDRRELAWNIYLGHELGLDVEKLLNVRDYRDEDSATAYEDLRPEVDRWVRLRRPKGLANIAR
jgi:hypothetical protein